MSTLLSPRHVNIEIAKYVEGYLNREYTLPIWQRQECWLKNYRRSLIDSIMMGIDLPKLYIGEISGLGKIIIDGGHRTRAIAAYLDNKFSITVDSISVFYSETPVDTKSSRIMNEREKNHLDKYQLTVCIYDKLTESLGRKIFNKLQNAVPMSVPDVVNSYESPLVDALREFLEHEVAEINIKEYFNILKTFPKPENNEDLYQILSLVTICWPVPTDNNQKEALRWIEKGISKNSRCFQYLQAFDDSFGEVTDEMKTKMNDFLEKIIEVLNEKNHKLPGSDFNTLCHSMLWVKNFSVPEFWTFFEVVQDYNSEKTRATKSSKKGQYDIAKEINSKAEKINESYNNKLSTWIGSRRNGGSGEEGMKVRLEIIKEYCIIVESEEESEDESEEELGPNILDDFGNKIPKVNAL
jgi:hypothetical protein